VVKSGKVIWGICFVLLLLSSPLIVRDLIAIQQGIERSAGADFWYGWQLNRELLRLDHALLKAEHDGTEASAQSVRVRLDIAFSRINTLPRVKSDFWHTQGVADLPEVEKIRGALEEIDAALPLLDVDLPAFIEAARPHVEEALRFDRDLTNRLGDRQNVMIGQMQSLITAIWHKLLIYGAGFSAVMAGLAYLMMRHMRSERGLRVAYHRLTEMTQGLTTARDDAIRASRAKSNFLANVSHELRTPLNAIIGFAEMLGGGYCGRLTGKQGEYVGDIHGAAQRLLALINDILDLSKLEAGKHELAEEVFDIAEIVRQSTHDLREEVRKAGLTVELDLSAAPPVVIGDASKLRQVVDNLMANAVKFTDSGGTIRLSVLQSPDGGVELTVADTGIGIAESDVRKIFQPFEQIDSGQARQHKGTGLGLPLVKGLVELHDGLVTLRSAVGVGTTVVVKLPSERVRRMTPTPEGDPATADPKSDSEGDPHSVNAIPRPYEGRRNAGRHR